jgi:hypothetical protein
MFKLVIEGRVMSSSCATAIRSVHPVERMSEENEVAPVRTTNDPAQKF